MSTETALEARGLVVDYQTQHGPVRALDGATLTVRSGSVHALVGESGSGKTTLGMASGRLLASNAHRTSGSLVVAGEDVFELDRKRLQALRRDTLGFVFQNPVASLDPTMRIERQMHVALADRTGATAASESLEQVGLKDVRRVLRAYPHELSGGMAQRVCIAMALRRSPRVLVADEPTASVDATVREQILELLVTRCREQGCTLLLLTHDLQAVQEHADQVSVMHRGVVVENGSAPTVLTTPSHPYTRALLSAQVGHERRGERIKVVRYVDQE